MSQCLHLFLMWSISLPSLHRTIKGSAIVKEQTRYCKASLTVCHLQFVSLPSAFMYTHQAMWLIKPRGEQQIQPGGCLQLLKAGSRLVMMGCIYNTPKGLGLSVLPAAMAICISIHCVHLEGHNTWWLKSCVCKTDRMGATIWLRNEVNVFIYFF